MISWLASERSRRIDGHLRRRWSSQTGAKRTDGVIGEVICVHRDCGPSGDAAVMARHRNSPGRALQPKRTTMTLVAALDVSTTSSALCVVDRLDGRIVFETSVASEPDAIAAALEVYRSRLQLVGHEAGALAPWLHRELQA